MSELNLDYDYNIVETNKFPVPAILKSIAFTLLLLGAIAGAALSGYYYSKYRETNAKLDAIQSDIAEINERLAKVDDFSKDDLGRKIDDLNGKLDGLETNLKAVKQETDDIDKIKTDISSIQSDISSIQIKIGY